jgi:dTDP-4-amino-4,6-dideoxy-D-glucose transaminase
LSFHATKIMNTFEGGAIVCSTPELKKKVDQLNNFGYVDETTVEYMGLNGKLSEFNAALGVAQLKLINSALVERKRCHFKYKTLLEPIQGIEIPVLPSNISPNYAYFPVLFGKEFPFSRKKVQEKLKSSNIFARPYFFPLVSNTRPYKQLPSARIDNLPVANEIADRILCLPIYPSLDDKDIETIVDIVKA